MDSEFNPIYRAELYIKNKLIQTNAMEQMNKK